MNTVSYRYYFYILRILEGLGVPIQQLSDIAPITTEDDERISARISIDELKALMDQSERHLNDGHIGLHISQKFRISGYGYAGDIYSACENTEQALAMSIKYACLAHTLGRFEVVSFSEPHQSLSKYTWQPSFEPNSVDNFRHITECIINNYVETIKWLTWGLGDCVAGITFQHSAKEPVGEYYKIFGCEPVFEAPETSVILRQDILQMPLSTANPVKLSLLEKKLNLLLVKYNMERDLVERTKFALHNVIKLRRPTLKIVAQELSLSERTFKRYLKNHGSHYQDLLQEVKMELCAGYMKEGLAYPEIAQLLWYYDQSALTRAYKKWHGVAPSKHLGLLRKWV